MESEEEMENGTASESSEDDVMEDLEVEKGTELNRSRGEDEHEDNENVDEDEVNGSAPKKPRLMSEKELKKLSKPATAEELNRLRETENLFHSNLFRLQIEEMLKEVGLKQKYKKEFQGWFQKFHSAVMKMEDCGKKHNVCDTEWLKPLKVKIPLPELPMCGKGTYQFKRPLNMELIGSYSLGTVVGPRVTVDVAVVLPQKFYHKDDFVNGVYHHKRALFLCDIVHRIQNLGEIVDEVHFISDDIDVLTPKVEITPVGKFAKYLKVLLHVTVKLQKTSLANLNPNQNNVKAKLFFNQESNSTDFNADVATPFYNSTILSDLTLMENYKYIQSALEPHRNIKDGIILLKVWLRQRELTSGLGDMSGFLVAAVVSYMLQNKKLNSYMSSYQVVRNFFNYLVSSDWTSNGITLCKKTNDCNIPSMAEFHQHHKVVFVDSTGYYNFCYGMHSSTFHQIQHAAQIALKALDDQNVNSFQILFMTSVPFYRQFDHVFMFHNDEALQNMAEIHATPEERLSHFGAVYPILVNMTYHTLMQGIRQRVNRFHVRQPQKNRWRPTKKFRYSINMSFGLNLNPENFFLVVDKATEEKTTEFREFWGSRSELRRFLDGSITEAVVWNAKVFSEKRLICKEVVNYLMKSKFGLDSSDIQYRADQFDQFVVNNMEESCMSIGDVFSKLSKQLRGLKKLPLDIVSVQGASPVFRYTEVFPLASAVPVSKKSKTEDEKKGKLYEQLDPDMTSAPVFVNPIHAVLQMAATNKWPQDLGAIQRLRAAFYLKIAQALVAQCQLKAMAFTDRIEVRKDGFVFHLRIFCPNEIGCVKQVVEDGVKKYRDNDLSLAIEKQMVLLPKLTSALHGLYEQHSSFGPACSIVKRWVNSQMLDPFHISEEVLEMIVASLYLKTVVYEITEQPQVAFLRFLHLMATTDWNSEYIVLNFNDELNREDLLKIESHFTANRDALPALFIATSYDRTNSLWTKDCPTPMILLRLVRLCRNALDFVEKKFYQNTPLREELELLFKPYLDPFDVIIYLNKDFIPRLKCAKVDVADEVETLDGPIPVNGFDPVAIFLQELRDTYGDVALFFYNTYGGLMVGVLWKPGVMEPNEFKVANMAMRSYDDTSGKLKFTKELVIEDFMIIGKKLVKSVDVKTENGSMKSYTYL